MKIPKSIKVGGHTHEVVIDKDLWHRENCHGEVNYERKTHNAIFICDAGAS